MTKLESLANGKLDESKVTELKSLLTDLKAKKSADLKLSETDRKEIAKEIQKETPINYWSIGACVLAGGALLASLIGFFFRSAKKEN